MQRDHGYFAAEARRPWTLGWMVLVSLAGLFVFGWSAASLWVFILLGLWSNVVQNALKLVLFHSAVRRFYTGYARTQEVWAVVDALRYQRDLSRVRVPEKNTTPLGLLMLDIGVFGAATAMIVFIARDRDIALFTEFLANRDLVMVTAATLAVDALLPLWQDRSKDRDGLTVVKYEGAGPAIFGWVLMFMFAAIAGDQDGLRWLILVVNGLLIVAIPLTVIGNRLTHAETRWLAERVGSGNLQGAGSAGRKTASKTPSR